MAAPAFPVAQEVKADDKPSESAAAAAEVEHPDFSGKWKIMSTENLAEFCKAAGISGQQFSMQKKAEKRQIQIIEQDGHIISVAMNTQVFERTLKFAIDVGQTFEYRDHHRNIVAATAKWDETGKKIVINCKVYAKGVNPNETPDDFTERKEVRYLKKGKMYEEITVFDETMIRKFQKQN